MPCRGRVPPVCSLLAPGNGRARHEYDARKRAHILARTLTASPRTPSRSWGSSHCSGETCATATGPAARTTSRYPDVTRRAMCLSASDDLMHVRRYPSGKASALPRRPEGLRHIGNPCEPRVQFGRDDVPVRRVSLCSTRSVITSASSASSKRCSSRLSVARSTAATQPAWSPYHSWRE